MDLTTTTVLALGTAGAQGSGLLDALAARGARAVRVTSDPARADGWRAGGHAASTADLTDPASLVAAAPSERILVPGIEEVCLAS